jgi:hypothetical protein
MGRVGEMDELANLAVFLMSDGCDYLTGQTIAIDGAMHLAPAAISRRCPRWATRIGKESAAKSAQPTTRTRRSGQCECPIRSQDFALNTVI